jgi:hypothetical protein
MSKKMSKQRSHEQRSHELTHHGALSQRLAARLLNPRVELPVPLLDYESKNLQKSILSRAAKKPVHVKRIDELTQCELYAADSLYEVIAYAQPGVFQGGIKFHSVETGDVEIYAEYYFMSEKNRDRLTILDQVLKHSHDFMSVYFVMNATDPAEAFDEIKKYANHVGGVEQFRSTLRVDPMKREVAACMLARKLERKRIADAAASLTAADLKRKGEGGGRKSNRNRKCKSRKTKRRHI